MYIVYNYSWLDLTYYKHEKSESKLIQLSSTIKIFFKINSNINIRILFTSCYACTFHFYFVMKYPIRKKKKWQRPREGRNYHSVSRVDYSLWTWKTNAISFAVRCCASTCCFVLDMYTRGIRRGLHFSGCKKKKEKKRNNRKDVRGTNKRVIEYGGGFVALWLWPWQGILPDNLTS